MALNNAENYKLKNEPIERGDQSRKKIRDGGMGLIEKGLKVFASTLFAKIGEISKMSKIVCLSPLSILLLWLKKIYLMLYPFVGILALFEEEK